MSPEVTNSEILSELVEYHKQFDKAQENGEATKYVTARYCENIRLMFASKAQFMKQDRFCGITGDQCRDHPPCQVHLKRLMERPTVPDHTLTPAKPDPGQVGQAGDILTTYMERLAVIRHEVIATAEFPLLVIVLDILIAKAQADGARMECWDD